MSDFSITCAYLPTTLSAKLTIRFFTPSILQFSLNIIYNHFIRSGGGCKDDGAGCCYSYCYFVMGLSMLLR